MPCTAAWCVLPECALIGEVVGIAHCSIRQVLCQETRDEIGKQLSCTVQILDEVCLKKTQACAKSCRKKN
jgi:hypothetical protein